VEFNIVDFFVHLDKYLDIAIRQYGILTYAILFFVIFAETGFVFTPFLPGDSLLFAAGTLSVISVLNVHYLFILLVLAAVTGNSSNYLVGHLIGERIFNKYPRFLKREYLDRTHEFYEKHGGKTVIITRFIPILRTFAPFVAGVGSMTFGRFSVYNITGGVLWVGLFIYGGYFFGNIPLVKNNFSIVTIAIILISILPAVIEFIRQKRRTIKPEKSNL
jgi:membrane-associated protein